MHPVQATLDELGTALSTVTFVVVDLETTGGSPETAAITEIGAVKVRGGEVMGEFQTLVNPGRPIPEFISTLTGIRDAMVAACPRIDSVLPSFLEFSAGAVLVAHNARFDVGFLKAAASSTGTTWPDFPVLDTVHLARHLVAPDEARNRKLSTLAALFGATTTPNHRALDDARATVDVLHALIGRVGNQGVHTLEELLSYSSRVSPAQRRKRFLADELPQSPGVYVFRDERGRALYVGTSRNLRARVRSYFTASEQRTRMAEMVAAATSVQPIVCQTALEAQVRELRLIADQRPRFNRRSTRPDRLWWVKLTRETFPRLSIVRAVRRGDDEHLGPFRSKQAAEDAVAAIHEILPLRRCTTRLSVRRASPSCALAEMGRCPSPCDGRAGVDDYAPLVTSARELLTGSSHELPHALTQRMRALSAQERFEDAQLVRDRLNVLLRGLVRAQRLGPVSAIPEIVAARRGPSGGWELVCVRYGRLAGVSVTPRGADPMPYVDTLRQLAEVVDEPDHPGPAASVEEAEIVLGWLEDDQTRIVSLQGDWSCPVNGAARVEAGLQRPTPLASGPVPGRRLSA